MRGIWTPKTFSNEIVNQAVEAIKKYDPSIWDRWVDHEKSEEGFEDIIGDIDRVLRETFGPLNGGDFVKLRFQVRQAARKQAGVPI